MAKPLVVVITRMHAYKGAPGVAEGDEYVSVWLRDQEEEHKAFQSDVCDFLLLHGYQEKYEAADDEKQTVAGQIKEAIESYEIKPDEYEEGVLYLLYHGPRRGFMLSPDDVAPAFGGRRVRVARYSSVPDEAAKILGPGAVGALEQLGSISKDAINYVKRLRSMAPGIQDQPKPSTTVSARREAFSHLKHQITQLFLPLSIDLQGMEQTGGGAAQLDYAADILKDRSGQKSLTQRFSELRFLVAKVDDRPDKSLARDSQFFSVWEQLDSDLQESDAGRNLLALSGLVAIDHQPATDHVSKYFSDLDGVSEPAKLMPAMTAPFQIALWDNGREQVVDLTFDAWLNKLDSVLDELRTMLMERARQEAVQEAAN